MTANENGKGLLPVVVIKAYGIIVKALIRRRKFVRLSQANRLITPEAV